ncbi:hypothetical protein pVa21_176 [Vibrio phage pVa-21]|nr:hypothetical protein pVa21_176 [Vibrio phage pVa-21]
MPNKNIAFLRTSQVAKEDVYRKVPAEVEGEKPTEELVCRKGEVNPETAVFTGPWYRDELEKWIDHSYDMNGGANTEWKLVEEEDLPKDFKDTNILQ